MKSTERATHSHQAQTARNAQCVNLYDSRARHMSRFMLDELNSTACTRRLSICCDSVTCTLKLSYKRISKDGQFHVLIPSSIYLAQCTSLSARVDLTRRIIHKFMRRTDTRRQDFSPFQQAQATKLQREQAKPRMPPASPKLQLRRISRKLAYSELRTMSVDDPLYAALHMLYCSGCLVNAPAHQRVPASFDATMYLRMSTGSRVR